MTDEANKADSTVWYPIFMLDNCKELSQELEQMWKRLASIPTHSTTDREVAQKAEAFKECVSLGRKIMGLFKHRGYPINYPSLCLYKWEPGEFRFRSEDFPGLYSEHVIAWDTE